jgi:hypothetical protein
MAVLRQMQEIEERYRARLCALYGVDEDHLPFDFDILKIVQVPPPDRVEHLVRGCFAGIFRHAILNRS